MRFAHGNTRLSRSASRRVGLLALLAMLLLIQPRQVRAHGDLDLQIDAVSAQIDQQPNVAHLLLKRAELYRNVEHFLFANDDLNQAADLDPSLAAVHLARARNYLEWKKPALGLPEAEAFLATGPERQQRVLAQEVRGQLLIQLGRPLEAADAFSDAIELSTPPSPDLYMFRVAAYKAAGDAYLPAAITSLDEGIARLGPAISLIEPALELEIRLQRYDAALDRIHRIVTTFPRTEAWLARRGDVLKLAGRNEQARAAYEQALEKIATLPERHRTTQATANLAQRIHSRLQEISAPATAAANSNATRETF